MSIQVFTRVVSMFRWCFFSAGLVNEEASTLTTIKKKVTINHVERGVGLSPSTAAAKWEPYMRPVYTNNRPLKGMEIQTSARQIFTQMPIPRGAAIGNGRRTMYFS